MARRLRKLLLLPIYEKRLLLEALLFAALFRTALWLVPFRTIQRLLKRLSRLRSPSGAEILPAVVTLAVMRASRIIPHASCLTQALTAKLLLAWNGHPAGLRIGVGRGDNSEFAAHAWLECDGRVVIGDRELERYTAFSGLDKEFER